MPIDRAEVQRIARLAHLELEDPDVDALARDLESILDHVAMLDELDVSELEPTTAALDTPHVLREDETRPSVPGDDALANAPEAGDGFFRVPRVLEG